MRNCPWCGMEEAVHSGRQIIYVCGTTAFDEDAPYVQSPACDRIDALQRDGEKWRALVDEIQEMYVKDMAALRMEKGEPT